MAGVPQGPGQVCKRVGRRLKELGLTELGEYRKHLETHPEEWVILDGFCRITISRFFRDRGVYETLGSQVLPDLARRCASTGESATNIWSAGCGAGEEPYSIAILCHSSDDPDLQRAEVRISGMVTHCQVPKDSMWSSLRPSRSGATRMTSISLAPVCRANSPTTIWQSAADS